MDPARIFTESLTPRPELENSQDSIAISDAEISRRRGLTLLLAAAIAPMAARKLFVRDPTLDIVAIDGWILRASDLKNVVHAL